MNDDTDRLLPRILKGLLHLIVSALNEISVPGG